MKRSKEELTRIHKEKCKELKKVRAKMAEDLGIDLHQRECTYEGYCSGTCPKCMKEEMMLNTAIRKRQMQESDIKRRVAAAGLTTAAAVCLSGCNVDSYQIDGDMQYIPEETVETLEGDVAYIDTEELEGAIAAPDPETVEGELAPIPCEEETEKTEETEEAAIPTIMELEGDIAYIPTEEWELAGEVPYYEEPGVDEAFDETTDVTEEHDSETGE